jgi:hypothetical protein
VVVVVVSPSPLILLSPPPLILLQEGIFIKYEKPQKKTAEDD